MEVGCYSISYHREVKLLFYRPVDVGVVQEETIVGLFSLGSFLLTELLVNYFLVI